MDLWARFTHPAKIATFGDAEACAFEGDLFNIDIDRGCAESRGMRGAGVPSDQVA